MYLVMGWEEVTAEGRLLVASGINLPPQLVSVVGLQSALLGGYNVVGGAC